MRLLLEHRADPNFKSKAGLAPLHQAARSAYGRDIAELLVTSADINIRDNDGRTPLDHANGLKLVHMAEFLTSKGGRSGENLSARWDLADARPTPACLTA